MFRSWGSAFASAKANLVKAGRSFAQISNCLIFAILLYQRRKNKDIAYISMRASHISDGPHFLYERISKVTGKHRVVSYVPLDPKVVRCPPPFFKGKVRWGDPLPTQNMIEMKKKMKQRGFFKTLFRK